MDIKRVIASAAKRMGKLQKVFVVSLILVTVSVVAFNVVIKAQEKEIVKYITEVESGKKLADIDYSAMAPSIVAFGAVAACFLLFTFMVFFVLAKGTKKFVINPMREDLRSVLSLVPRFDKLDKQ